MSWSCEDTARALEAKGDQELCTDAAMVHLDHCGTCAVLLEAGLDVSEALALSPLGESRQNELPQSAPTSSSSLGAWQELAEELQQEQHFSRRYRSLSTRAVLVGMVLLVTLPLLFQAVLKLRPDAGFYPIWRWWTDTSSLMIALASVATLLVWPQQKPRNQIFAAVGASGWWVVSALGLLLPLGLAFAGPAHVAHPGSLPVAPEDFFSRARACFLYGSAFAAPLALFLFMTGRSQIGSPGKWAAIACLWGLLGNCILLLHCPLTSVEHILAGHASIGVVLTSLVGMAAVWLQVRAQSSRSK